MKKSGSNLKLLKKSIVRPNRLLLMIVSIPMAILLAGALYSFKTDDSSVHVNSTQSSTYDPGGSLIVGNHPSGTISQGNEPPQAQELLRQINNARVANGASPVNENKLLNQSASLKVADMIKRNYWAHNTPDGTEPWVFIRQADYKYHYAGENLWYGRSNTTARDWANSPTHKAVMLDGRYSEIGISIMKANYYNGEQNVYVVVTHYASPQNGSYIPQSSISSVHSSASSYNYQLPSYGSASMPDFSSGSVSDAPKQKPRTNCGADVDSSYYANCIDNHYR